VKTILHDADSVARIGDVISDFGHNIGIFNDKTHHIMNNIFGGIHRANDIVNPGDNDNPLGDRYELDSH
jgi:hypothetical protein